SRRSPPVWQIDLRRPRTALTLPRQGPVEGPRAEDGAGAAACQHLRQAAAAHPDGFRGSQVQPSHPCPFGRRPLPFAARDDVALLLMAAAPPDRRSTTCARWASTRVAGSAAAFFSDLCKRLMVSMRNSYWRRFRDNGEA